VMLVGPGQAAILNYTMPLWASLLAAPVLGERLDRRTLVHRAGSGASVSG
jgi:drug/metabolite transporter (DMT)-like permease